MSMIVNINKKEWADYPLDKKELFLARLRSSNVHFKNAIINMLEGTVEKEKQANQIDFNATFKKAYEEDDSWQE